MPCLRCPLAAAAAAAAVTPPPACLHAAAPAWLLQELVAECPAAKELFDKAAGILGYDLLQLCVEGPKEKLDSTVYSQVGVMMCGWQGRGAAV